MTRSSELKHKEIINIADGRRLGFASDVEIDLEEGRIEALVIPITGRLFGFIGKENEVIIPWERVKKVGEDIIFVDLDERYLRKYFE